MIVNAEIKAFSDFAVPLFLFISGFLLYQKYNKNYSLKEFYKKRFWRIIPPYLVFTTFYLICDILLRVIYDTGVITFPPMITFPPISDIIYAYLTAGGLYHLWFFLVIIELYLLYPIIINIYNYFKDKGCAILFPILSLVVRIIWQVFGSNFHIQLFGYEWSSIISVFLCNLFYFALGIYVCNHYHVIKEWVLEKSIWIFVAITAICTIIGSSLWLTGIVIYGSYFDIPSGSFIFYESLLQPFFYLFTFAFLFSLSNKMVHAKHNFKWISIISLYSFGIYLIHPFFQTGFTFLINMIGIDYETAIYYPLTFIVILLSSMLFVYIVRKFPFYKYIIG